MALQDKDPITPDKPTMFQPTNLGNRMPIKIPEILEGVILVEVVEILVEGDLLFNQTDAPMLPITQIHEPTTTKPGLILLNLAELIQIFVAFFVGTTIMSWIVQQLLQKEDNKPF